MMKKTHILPYVIAVAAVALLYAVTLPVPNHGNGSGFEYDFWLTFLLYPACHLLFGIVLGIFAPLKRLLLTGAALYAVALLAFFANYVIDVGTLPPWALLSSPVQPTPSFAPSSPSYRGESADSFAMVPKITGVIWVNETKNDPLVTPTLYQNNTLKK